MADLYALQRSRRHFGTNQLEESSEVDDDDYGRDSGNSANSTNGFFRERGIRSSWRGGKSASGPSGGGFGQEPLAEQAEEEDQGNRRARSQSVSSRGKGKMVDIRLEDSFRDDMVNIDSAESPSGFNDGEVPPAIRQLRNQKDTMDDGFQASSAFMPQETDKQALLDNPRPPSSAASTVPQSMSHPDPEPPSHDMFWGHLFLIAVGGLFATAFIVYLHTSPPARTPMLGDTIYSTLHASFGLLGTYTLVSIFVSLLWLALLRSYVRPLVYGMLVAVPVILFSFSLYPFVSSFKGTWHGNSIQDKVMRWGSLVPMIMACAWTYSVIKGRHSAGKAIGILEFSCKILGTNPALLLLGFATLGVIAAWTWIWILMFTRVFLGGHLSSAKNFFVINLGSWWLGVYFILVYLWSLGVISGIQRTITAATVSQWYFHRLAVPSPSSRDIVHAAFIHALTTLFGTICLSTLLALVIRVPLIVLPRRLSSLVALAAYSLVPTPIASLTNPLTLSYAAIHSQPLTTSSRSLSQMPFLAPSSATATTFHPRTFSDSHRTDHYASTLMPYRLAKLLLHATRFMMSLALGFGGWVSTARSLQIPNENNGGGSGSTLRGSLYAYVVGLIAGAIGWGVLSAMEGVLAGIVDAAVVCWASEVGSSRREARYCREAGWLFGGGATDRYQEDEESRL